MGKFSITSETVFAHDAEKIYDFVSDPRNWGRTYKGSGGMHEGSKHLTIPLKIGDVWTEKVDLPPNQYHSTWTLITARRPTKFAFQQINKVGVLADGSGGVEELPKGVGIPDDLLTVCCRPDGIDRYHAAVERELDEQFGKPKDAFKA